MGWRDGIDGIRLCRIKPEKTGWMESVVSTEGKQTGWITPSLNDNRTELIARFRENIIHSKIICSFTLLPLSFLPPNLCLTAYLSICLSPYPSHLLSPVQHKMNIMHQLIDTLEGVDKQWVIQIFRRFLWNKHCLWERMVFE